MLALQMLLDKLNSGKIPISPEMINKSKSGTSHRQGSINVRTNLCQIVYPRCKTFITNYTYCRINLQPFHWYLNEVLDTCVSLTFVHSKRLHLRLNFF